MNYLPTFYNLNSNFDYLKKRSSKNVQNLLSSNNKKLFIFNLNKEILGRYAKIASFWSLEIVTLQKAFFNYKLKTLRKSFYLPYSSSSELIGTNILSFLYTFSKEALFTIPHLIYFFNVLSVRNLKVESISLNSFFNHENKIFYNIGNFFFILKGNRKLSQNLWLSFYKIIL